MSNVSCILCEESCCDTLKPAGTSEGQEQGCGCRTESKIVAQDATWKEVTRGGNIAFPGNAALFMTGDWRSMKPIWVKEKCKQCLLCYPVCPDTSILIDADGKRTDFDYDHCKGCGVCVRVCPFKAIDFIEEG